MFTTNNKGQLSALQLDGQAIPLNTKKGAGPSFYIQNKNRITLVKLAPVKGTAGSADSSARFTATKKGISYELSYAERTAAESTPVAYASHTNHTNRGVLEITCTITNQSNATFAPETCGLKLGVDSWMASYPSWNDKLFPTHLRCEKTHFTGYMMSPKGDILALASPEPIASWSLDYNNRGHRIRTANLDLLNANPLPKRHPENCEVLAPGISRTWRIRLSQVNSLQEVPALLANLSEAPWIEMQDTTVEQGKPVNCIIHTPHADGVQGADMRADLRAVLIAPSGAETPLALTGSHGTVAVKPKEIGVHSLRITTGSGDTAGNTTDADGVAGSTASTTKTTEASFYCRHPLSWYMNCARKEALRSCQLATTHCESLYGFYTLYRAELAMPDAEILAQAEERWQTVMPQLINFDTLHPTIIPWRIQNGAAHINMLCDRFKVIRDPQDLDHAIGMAHWLIDGHQHSDGSYRSGKWGNIEKGIHYTSVIYPAMNLMELYDLLTTEESAGRRKDDGTRSYVYNSIQRAMDELERNRDNIDTEGELTFEDGMISCSAAQLARFALMQEDTAERERYTKAAQDLLYKHRCLTQLLTPDTRQRGATLRYWEAQYDLITFPNMMNSPHGWTSWRSYALYYLYLLTGEADLLQQLMNVIGTCMQVINHTTGELRWAFIADPYVRAWELKTPTRQWDKDTYNKVPHYHQNPPKRKMEHRIIGEEYLSMNSSWQYGNPNDNDVHEHFRLLAEVMLTQSFVLETEEGIQSWNIDVDEVIDQTSGTSTLVLTPAEDIVTRVHCNFLQPRRVKSGALSASGGINAGGASSADANVGGNTNADGTHNATQPQTIQRGWYQLA